MNCYLTTAKAQEQVFDLREQGMQLTEELFQRKIAWEVKNQFTKLNIVKHREDEMK